LSLTSLHTRGNAASIQIPEERGRLTEEDAETVVLDGEQSAKKDNLLLKRASNTLPGSVGSIEEAKAVGMEEQEMGEYSRHLKHCCHSRASADFEGQLGSMASDDDDEGSPRDVGDL
jgi:hypothetical protein